MNKCYKCTCNQVHPIHDNGTPNKNYDHSLFVIDWYKEAREAMEKRRVT